MAMHVNFFYFFLSDLCAHEGDTWCYSIFISIADSRVDNIKFIWKSEKVLHNDAKIANMLHKNIIFLSDLCAYE